MTARPITASIAATKPAPLHVIVIIIGGGIDGLTLAQGYRICGMPSQGTEHMKVLLALSDFNVLQRFLGDGVAQHLSVSRITLRQALALLFRLEDFAHFGKTFARYEEAPTGRVDQTVFELHPQLSTCPYGRLLYAKVRREIPLNRAARQYVLQLKSLLGYAHKRGFAPFGLTPAALFVSGVALGLNRDVELKRLRHQWVRKCISRLVSHVVPGQSPRTGSRPLIGRLSFCPVFRSVLPSRELAQVAPVVVQESERPHAEAVIVSVKMQPREVRLGTR
jgi:hypothetical protein